MQPFQLPNHCVTALDVHGHYLYFKIPGKDSDRFSRSWEEAQGLPQSCFGPGSCSRGRRPIRPLASCNFRGFFLFSQMFLIRWLYSILDYVSDCWDSLFHSNWYRLGINES